MDDQSHDAVPEPVRSRWTPKPEQILILESIFNSGMVNPPKEETVRIRKLLEKFGTVGDANVFYWFQNRRSRSRRRQRQMQAGLANSESRVSSGANFQFGSGTTTGDSSTGGGASFYECNSSGSWSGGLSHSPYSSSYSNQYSGCYSSGATSSSSHGFVGDEMSSGGGGGGEDLFAISRQMGYMENNQSQYGCGSGAPSQWQYQTGTISVFINGVPMEVPRGSFNLRATFDQDVVLVTSSGELLPVNEYGSLMQSLQMGESYFAVPRST
ncbi:WUSCHEL related homeobox 11 [Rhynchospora pubera]|uniref:WUSCHEL related homeobox 11 n=1 Tax=Rhynchospora pubera TaxID=906938 RepID=A0AAV8CEG1_9POAL|nr:WUSCHEL related homeobox 11 [Rhynchospora pubera]